MKYFWFLCSVQISINVVNVWARTRFRESSHGTRVGGGVPHGCPTFLFMGSDKWSAILESVNHPNCKDGIGIRPTWHVPYMGTTCQPWFTKCAIAALDRIVTNNMIGLEWSSGSSTLWFLERLGSLDTIEHHRSCFEVLNTYLARERDGAYLQRWQGILVEATPLEESLNKETTVLDTDGTPGNFFNYATALVGGNKTYDLISVGGRARVHCLRTILAFERLKAYGGVLILDNS